METERMTKTLSSIRAANKLNEKVIDAILANEPLDGCTRMSVEKVQLNMQYVTRSISYTLDILSVPEVS